MQVEQPYTLVITWKYQDQHYLGSIESTEGYRAENNSKLYEDEMQNEENEKRRELAQLQVAFQTQGGRGAM